MNADSREPTLDDAKARITRAEEHIGCLEREIAAISPDREITVMTPGGYVPTEVAIQPPPRIKILIGETLYNLRAALDYLVYELFYLDAGRRENNTKFPIEESKKAWDRHFSTAATACSAKKRSNLWLPELTSVHQTTLKGLQPFEGCKWPLFLKRSNIDKHRRLLQVETSGDKSFMAPGPMAVTIKLTSKIAFEDGSFVVEKLNLLNKNVAEVIEAFVSDFSH